LNGETTQSSFAEKNFNYFFLDNNSNNREMKEMCERENGKCPECGEPARLRTCSVCGVSQWIIDCGHFDQPRPIAAGRQDGSESYKDFCEDCA
jgi:hypothetical protein